MPIEKPPTVIDDIVVGCVDGAHDSHAQVEYMVNPMGALIIGRNKWTVAVYAPGYWTNVQITTQRDYTQPPPAGFMLPTN